MSFKRNVLLTATGLMLTLGVSITKLNAQESTENPIDTLARSVVKIQDDLAHLKKLKFSGYIQAQYQVADSIGAASYAGGNFPQYSDKRFAVRRGRLKAVYTGNWSQYVLQIDVTEKGVGIKDAYVKITDPWTKWVSLTAGVFNRPFGFEVEYSSSSRESPERGRMSQIIFPGERDLGAMITLQAPKTSPWNFLKADFAVINGTGGTASDFDFQKDIIARVRADKSSKNEKIKWGLGASYYDGGVRQGTSKVYTINADSAGLNAFKMNKDTANFGAMAKRQYVGVDGQVSIDFPFGITTLRGEYIQGQQPGTSTSTTSPSTQPGDVYVRNFNGAYFYFVQNIMQSKHAIVVKYDWYDPNTSISGDNIGAKILAFQGTTYKTTGTQDITYTTLGLGYIYKLDSNVKFTVYYDKVTNEKSINLGSSAYWKDLKDNVLTVRVQYKF